MLNFQNQLPNYAQHAQSQIVQTNSLDGCVMVVAELLTINMEIDNKIEQLLQGIQLGQNSNFYPEAMFAYLKNYSQMPKQKKGFFQSFFDFGSADEQKPIIINLINSSKDGLIPFKNIVDFIYDTIGVKFEIENMKELELLYHSEQYAIGQNQVSDAYNQHYPLPPDVQQQLHQNQQAILQAQRNTNIQQYQQQTPVEVLNSGNGFNYNTFKKMFVCYSIPKVRNGTLKRKLIYESNNQQSDIDTLITSDCKKLIISIIQLEIELHLKSEQLRVKLAQDPSWNPFQIFNAMDLNCEEKINYQAMEHVMKRTQFLFNPKYFEAITRRAQILGNNKQQKTYLNFDDFRLITSVRSSYFKLPQNPTEQNNNTTILVSGNKTDKYQVHKVIGQTNKTIPQTQSRLLDTNFTKGVSQIAGTQGLSQISRLGGSSMNSAQQFNSKLRCIQIDDDNQVTSHRKNNVTFDSFQGHSYVQGQAQATIPKYYSNNANVNQVMNQYSNSSKLMDPKENVEDHIVYGTMNDWNEMQHQRMTGYNQQNHSSQSSQSQPNNNNLLVIPNSNFDYVPQQQQEQITQQEQQEMGLKTQADVIVGETYQQINKQKQLISKNWNEVYDAKHTNTQGYNVMNYKQQTFGQHTPTFTGAPWQNIDKHTVKNIEMLNKQQAELRSMIGLQQQDQGQDQNLPHFGNGTQQQQQQPQQPQQPQQQQQQQQQQQNIDLKPLSNRQNMMQQNASRTPSRSKIFGNQTSSPLVYNDLQQSKLMNYQFDAKTHVQPKPSLF